MSLELRRLELLHYSTVSNRICVACQGLSAMQNRGSGLTEAVLRIIPKYELFRGNYGGNVQYTGRRAWENLHQEEQQVSRRMGLIITGQLAANTCHQVASHNLEPIRRDVGEYGEATASTSKRAERLRNSHEKLQQALRASRLSSFKAWGMSYRTLRAIRLATSPLIGVQCFACPLLVSIRR